LPARNSHTDGQNRALPAEPEVPCLCSPAVHPPAIVLPMGHFPSLKLLHSPFEVGPGRSRSLKGIIANRPTGGGPGSAHRPGVEQCHAARDERHTGKLPQCVQAVCTWSRLGVSGAGKSARGSGCRVSFQGGGAHQTTLLPNSSIWIDEGNSDSRGRCVVMRWQLLALGFRWR